MRFSHLNYFERRALREANAAANAAKRAARNQAAMTCQVCNRAILANTGSIAHHGYQRPCEGWQTSSCNGAKALPFECARDALASEINFAKGRVERLQGLLKETQDEARDLPWTFRDKTVTGGRFRDGETTKYVSRANFDEVATYRVSVARYRYAEETPTYDVIKKLELAKIAGNIKSTESYIATQQARYDGWKQTHRREGDQWVAL